MDELQSILQGLTKEEQQAVIQILQEQAKTGSSSSYNSLISADYDEIPVSIEEFISNSRYAGNYLQVYYPFWKEQLINIFDRGKHYSEIAFTGSIGTGKVNSMETPLLGASGWFLMRDARPGMKVFGEDGKLHTILKIWPNGTLPVYKVSFSDGSWVECGLDHNWTVRDYTRMKKQVNKVSYDRWVTMTTKEIMDKGLWAYPDKKDKNGHRQCQRRFAIPVTQPIQFEPKGELPVHPYVLGQLLSDGAISTNSMYLHAYEEDVANKFNEIIRQNYNCELVHDSNEVENYGDYRIVGVHRGINVLVQKIRELKLNKTAPYKYIPEVYLYSSVEDRIQLLQGLFDGDGSIQEKRYTYSTVSENLYKDMTFLIESLGGSVFRTEGKPCWRTVNGTKHFTGNKCWEFQFKLPDAIKPFTSKKHEKRYGGGTKFDTSKIYRFIDKIEYIRDDECQCITVDNPSGLYITKDFIVTHNSSMAIVGMAYVLYQLMCLKNPQKYWGTNKTMYFAFFNNNLDLAKSVGFAAFHDLIRKSDWFLENGEFRGKVNQVYHPYKDIELMAGSLPSHVIGKDVFCLTGDTVICTNRGYIRLDGLVGKTFRVKQAVDNSSRCILSDECIAVKTKTVYELFELILENGSIIKCTADHKFRNNRLWYQSANTFVPGDYLYSDNGNIKIIETRYHEVTGGVDVYDIVNAHPYNNFGIVAGDHIVFAHNCALQDELNFCLSGDTKIYTSKGSKQLKDVTPLDIIYNYSNDRLCSCLSKGGQPTRFVDEYIQIELEDGTVLKCSDNHMFMLKDGSYKCAGELTEEDELLEYVPYGYVYITTNHINGRKYIGKHKGLFDPAYLGSGDILSMAIRKRGKENFSVEVLDWAKTAEELAEKEEYWIKTFNAVDSVRYYNVCKGSNPPVYQGRVCVHRDNDIKYIEESQLEEYLENGYLKGSGLGKSMQGKICVKRESELEWISVEDVDKYESEGWKIPRPNDGKIVINNGVNIKYVYENELEEYLNDGWQLGNHVMKGRAGTVWMTDGDIDIIVDKDKIAEYELKGFYRGRNYFRTHIYVNKDGVDTLIPAVDLKAYEAKGYKKGKFTSNAKGTCWIRKGEETRRIPSKDLAMYEAAGWENTNFFVGKCRIWNPELKIRKNVLPEEVDSYIAKGWEYNPQTRCKGAIAYENLKNSKN